MTNLIGQVFKKDELVFVLEDIRKDGNQLIFDLAGGKYLAGLKVVGFYYEIGEEEKVNSDHQGWVDYLTDKSNVKPRYYDELLDIIEKETK